MREEAEKKAIRDKMKRMAERERKERVWLWMLKNGIR